MINTDFLFAGTMLTGLLIACWARLKMVIWRITGLMIVRVSLNGLGATSVVRYAHATMKPSPFQAISLFGAIGFVRPRDKMMPVLSHEMSDTGKTFWSGWRPLFIQTRQISYGEGGAARNDGVTVQMSYLRGMFDWKKLTWEAVEYLDRQHSAKSESTRFCVYKQFGTLTRERNRSDGASPAAGRDDSFNMTKAYVHWTEEEIGNRKSKSPFASLAFPEEAQEAIQLCQRWLSSEKWYKSKQIPWRMGWLLYGPPGTGKTSFVRALGQKFDMPIFSFDLSTFGNEDFSSSWNSCLSNSPAIVLLEDIDAVFEGRINRNAKAQPGALTFDCLLNCLSGAQQADGLLLFVTTNRLECLDEALGVPKNDHDSMSTRPGRVDRVLYLGAMSKSARQRLADRILDAVPEDVRNDLVESTDGDTGAQFQSRCEKIALAYYWREKDQATKETERGWEEAGPDKPMRVFDAEVDLDPLKTYSCPPQQLYEIEA